MITKRNKQKRQSQMTMPSRKTSLMRFTEPLLPPAASLRADRQRGCKSSARDFSPAVEHAALAVKAQKVFPSPVLSKGKNKMI
jgi:hypothetical protein